MCGLGSSRRTQFLDSAWPESLLIWNCHPLWQNEQPWMMCVGGLGHPRAGQSTSHPQETLLIGRVMLVSLLISEISFSLIHLMHILYFDLLWIIYFWKNTYVSLGMVSFRTEAGINEVIAPTRLLSLHPAHSLSPSSKPWSPWLSPDSLAD